jgi:hypothetical protein
MLIQVLDGHDLPIIRKFNSNGKEIVVYEQTLYMHKGGAFPEPFKHGHQQASEVLPVGDYNIDPSSFVTDNFGGLALSKYDKKFTRINLDPKKTVQTPFKGSLTDDPIRSKT